MLVYRVLTFVMVLGFQVPFFSADTVLQLTSNNIDDILGNTELVFVNFYADWCRFSQMLSPVFEQAGDKVKAAFPQVGKVVFAKVDCDREGGIAAKYHVSKYPTLKLFRYGSLVKREFRGQRSVDALSDFVKDQLKDIVSVASSLDELHSIDWKKRHVIGFYDSIESEDYKVFLKVASALRDDCQFHIVLGDVAAPERPDERNKVIFRPNGDYNNDIVFHGSTSDHSILFSWTVDKCVPIVREITFENAEELTEEGLPFMILFHHPEDTDTPDRFRRQVAYELMAQKSTVNFLTADGLKFTHPLHHLGKSANDLPILAIDSFRHMYIWKHSPRTDIDTSGLLAQFIADLHSGKLHREFHQGPDPTEAPPLGLTAEKSDDDEKKDHLLHIPKDVGDETVKTEVPRRTAGTSPPESLFKKLAPSRTRYTILRDEL